MIEAITPTLQIRNQSLVMFTQLPKRKKNILNSIGQKKATSEKTEIFKKAAYSGELSSGAVKRMSKAINLLVASSEKKTVYNPTLKKNVPFKLSFITLTIPTNKSIEAKEAHKLLLEPMIKHLRQVHGLKNYVWKLELQKRGQIHYHITSDCFINHVELRNKWNQLLAKNDMMSEYIAENNHTNANSTDIHSVKKVRDLSAYLIKYFTKKEQNPVAVKGKIWDCSLGLKKAKYYTTELTQDLEYDISKCVDTKICSVYCGDRFAIFKFRKIEPIHIFEGKIKEAYYQNLLNIRTYKRGLFECIEKQKVSYESDLKNILSKQVPINPQLYLFN